MLTGTYRYFLDHPPHLFPNIYHISPSGDGWSFVTEKLGFHSKCCVNKFVDQINSITTLSRVVRRVFEISQGSSMFEAVFLGPPFFL